MPHSNYTSAQGLCFPLFLKHSVFCLFLDDLVREFKVFPIFQEPLI